MDAVLNLVDLVGLFGTGLSISYCTIIVCWVTSKKLNLHHLSLVISPGFSFRVISYSEQVN